MSLPGLDKAHLPNNWWLMCKHQHVSYVNLFTLTSVTSSFSIFMRKWQSCDTGCLLEQLWDISAALYRDQNTNDIHCTCNCWRSFKSLTVRCGQRFSPWSLQIFLSMDELMPKIVAASPCRWWKCSLMTANGMSLLRSRCGQHAMQIQNINSLLVSDSVGVEPQGWAQPPRCPWHWFTVRDLT